MNPKTRGDVLAAVMPMRRLDDLAAKKELLIAQSEFDRIKLALAIHDIRRIVRPSFDPAQRSAASSTAARVLGFVLPLLGRLQAGRLLRAASIGLAVIRFLRGFGR